MIWNQTKRFEFVVVNPDSQLSGNLREVECTHIFQIERRGSRGGLELSAAVQVAISYLPRFGRHSNRGVELSLKVEKACSRFDL
jgi:hypothetical protein